MKWTQVYRIVFRKEFRELRRDRRALFWLFAPPFLLPLIAICGVVFIGSQALRIAGDGFPVVVENADQAPELVAQFEESGAIRLITPANPATNRFGDAVIIVAIPPDFQEQLRAGETVTIEIITRDNAIVSLIGQSAVRGIIDNYADELLDERLQAAGLTREFLNPIEIGERRVAGEDSEAVVGVGQEQEEGGGSAVATIFLPLAVSSWLLGGGLGLILDTTVGEKERQTIENLLVTPANRVGIVLGKLTVVFIASLAVMSLWLIEGLILNALSNASTELFGPENSPSLGEALGILLESGGGLLGLVGILVLVILPFIIMLNGFMMAVCAYAANYREANLFMALTQLGLPATVLITIFSVPPTVGLPVYAIPFFGAIVAIRDLFSGTLSAPAVAIATGFGLVYALVAILVAAWVFNREWSLTRGLQ